MLLVVVEIFANFLQDNTASLRQLQVCFDMLGVDAMVAYLIVGKSIRFRVVSWKPASPWLTSTFVVKDISRTFGVHGSLDCACDTGC